MDSTSSASPDTLQITASATIRPPSRRVIPVPSRLPIPAADWYTLVATRANTVIVAGENAAMMVLTAAWPTLQKPIHWVEVEADRLSLPRQSSGTLILQRADALSAPAQQQLFDWLERDMHATRIVATTERPLFPLVEAGSFPAALYFRLNMLLLVL